MLSAHISYTKESPSHLGNIAVKKLTAAASAVAFCWWAMPLQFVVDMSTCNSHPSLPRQNQLQEPCRQKSRCASLAQA
jgi:hypothetical protein